MRLSVVSTLYQSAPYLREFHARVSAAALKLTDDFEIVLVNDGSPDQSLDLAMELARSDPRVHIVDLSMNFGHHKAMMTGLGKTSGALVFLLDCDLEEPPEILDAFERERLRTGADVVYGVQSRRKGSLFERVTGWLYYKIYNRLSPEPIPENVITARLMTRRYVDSLVAHGEREVHIAGLWVTTGFQQVPLAVAKASRGASTYHISRRIGILVTAVTSFSNTPLMWIFYSGLVILTTSGAAAAYVIARVLFRGALLAGWASLIVSIWLLGGLTLFCIGLIGIYLSRIFSEVKKRPYTIVRAVYERGAEIPASRGQAAAG